MHISNIYNREEFRHKSLISKVANGVIWVWSRRLYYGSKCNKKVFLVMKIDKKINKELVDYLVEFKLTELEYQEGEKNKSFKSFKSS